MRFEDMTAKEALRRYGEGVLVVDLWRRPCNTFNNIVSLSADQCDRTLVRVIHLNPVEKIVGWYFRLLDRVFGCIGL